MTPGNTSKGAGKWYRERRQTIQHALRSRLPRHIWASIPQTFSENLKRTCFRGIPLKGRGSCYLSTKSHLSLAKGYPLLSGISGLSPLEAMPASEAREGFRQEQGLACLNGINESQEDVNGRLAASTTFHPFTTPIYSFICPVTGFLRWLVTISKKKKKRPIIGLLWDKPESPLLPLIPRL